MMCTGGGGGGVIAPIVVVELGGSHLIELYKMSYYSSKYYSEFWANNLDCFGKTQMCFENQNTFAKHICVLPKHFSVFICWACSSVSERHYPKAAFRKALS